MTHQNSLSVLLLCAAAPFCHSAEPAVAAAADATNATNATSATNATNATLGVTPSRPTTLSIGLSADSLGKGYANWTESSLRARHFFAPRTAGEIGVSHARRFGLNDTQLSGAFVKPFGDKLTGSVEASYSPGHRFLPRHHLGGSLQLEFAKAWLVQGAVAATRYDAARVQQTSLGLEHYFSDFSAGLSLRQARVAGVSANGVAVNGVWYYGDKDSIGLTIANGREASSVPGGVLLGKVSAIALVGRHAFSPAWSLNYSLSHTRQRGLYARRGISVGLAYSY